MSNSWQCADVEGIFFSDQHLSLIFHNIFIIVCHIGYIIIPPWKVSVFGVFLVRISPHSDRIRRETEYLSAFSRNTGKCGPEKRIRTRSVFMQFAKFVFIIKKITWKYVSNNDQGWSRKEHHRKYFSVY